MTMRDDNYRNLMRACEQLYRDEILKEIDFSIKTVPGWRDWSLDGPVYVDFGGYYEDTGNVSSVYVRNRRRRKIRISDHPLRDVEPQIRIPTDAKISVEQFLEIVTVEAKRIANPGAYTKAKLNWRAHPVSDAQKSYLTSLLKKQDKDPPDFTAMTKGEASELIAELVPEKAGKPYGRYGRRRYY